jgi:4-cresol dehydrogenase (hydroxylating)
MTSDDSSLHQAVAAWRRLLGPDRVSTTPEVDGYGNSTLARAEAPVAAVKVRSKQEVVGAVGIAARHRVPIYPISRGKNWGYGDACPVGPGQVLLDLSGMDRIREVDPDLAYAVIEPGVTQGQLHACLQEQGHPLLGPATDDSPDASVLGNLIDRGFGMAPDGDTAASICGMEVVLADGTVVETGLGHYPKAPRHVHRWGVGPQLDGLFTQSNLGIVVGAGVWLVPQPESFSVFRLAIDGDAELVQAIDRLRRLRLARTLRSPVFIANAFRTLAEIGTYPWKRTGGKTPLRREVAELLLGEAGAPGQAGRWNATGSLHGTRRGMSAAARDLKVALRGLGRLQLISPANSDDPRLDVLRGVPGTQGLGITRWRVRGNREGSGEDPTAEGCGLYWLAPVCPAKGEEVQRCAGMIEEQMLERGFEPLTRVAMASDRAALVTTLLTFDRRRREESRRAEECHRELTEKLLGEGYPPFRAGVAEMDLLGRDGAGYWRLVGTLKRALDPEGILAPGRYEPVAAARFRARAAAR